MTPPNIDTPGKAFWLLVGAAIGILLLGLIVFLEALLGVRIVQSILVEDYTMAYWFSVLFGVFAGLVRLVVGAIG